MKLEKIKNIFINFFISKKHILVPSSNLITLNDPTIMFTNSGMVQFKNIFLGKEKAKHKRVVSIQRCIRVGGKHNDLKNVGHTSTHNTFFEMLGNWSFGDYFKFKTLKWSWELLTKFYKLPEEKLLITIYKEDEESYDIWSNKIGIEKNQILLIGDKNNIKYKSSNFWEMAKTGPCGPSSEIFYNFGKYKKKITLTDIKKKNTHYIEIYNNVFMEFNKKINKKTNEIILKKLPLKCVDTGMGLERLAMILQNVKNIYEIDLFKKIIFYISKKINFKNKTNISLKIISDHLRASTFLIMDGVLPSNNKSGYILRKLIRRAIIYGYKIKKHDLFFSELVPIIIKEMNLNYPELIKKENKIKKIIKNEEILFKKTIKNGLKILTKILTHNPKTFNGKKAFNLYNTHGLPIYIILEICKIHNIKINIKEFNEEMKKQKKLSNKSKI